MPTQDTVSPARRASEEDRENVTGMLRHRHAGRRGAAGTGIIVAPGDRPRFGTAELRIARS